MCFQNAEADFVFLVRTAECGVVLGSFQLRKYVQTCGDDFHDLDSRTYVFRVNDFLKHA